MSIGSRLVWREETLDTNFYSLPDKGIFVLDIGKCLYISESFYVLTVKKAPESTYRAPLGIVAPLIIVRSNGIDEQLADLIERHALFQHVADFHGVLVLDGDGNDVFC